MIHLFEREVFAARLRAIRLERAMSTRAAAEAAGVSAPTISRAERATLLDVESWLRLERWLDPAGFPALNAALRRGASFSREGA